MRAVRETAASWASARICSKIVANHMHVHTTKADHASTHTDMHTGRQYTHACREQARLSSKLPSCRQTSDLGSDTCRIYNAVIPVDDPSHSKGSRVLLANRPTSTLPACNCSVHSKPRNEQLGQSCTLQLTVGLLQQVFGAAEFARGRSHSLYVKGDGLAACHSHPALAVGIASCRCAGTTFSRRPLSATR